MQIKVAISNVTRTRQIMILCKNIVNDKMGAGVVSFEVHELQACSMPPSDVDKALPWLTNDGRFIGRITGRRNNALP